MRLPVPALYIPLRLAYLCANCESIVQYGTCCYACGRQTLIPLASWLDREERKVGA